MVQVLDGADAFESFESFQCSPVIVLQPWMAMVQEVTTTAELSAMAHAVEAARYELEAFWYYRYAMSWLPYGEVSSISFALDWLKAMAQSLQRASWHWHQAQQWLTKYGEAHKAALYRPLLTQGSAQHERVTQVGIEVRRQVARLCQQWHLAIPDWFDDPCARDESTESGVNA